MKRNEIVEKLMKEGFSEKTLVKLNDKQLGMMAERMLGESLTATMADIQKSPTLQAAAKDPKQNIRVVGEEGDVNEELKGNQSKLDKNHNGKIDGQDFKILKGQKKEVKEGIFGGSHKKTKTIKHDGHEIDVFSNGSETLYGHPKKEGTKLHNDKERLVYSDLEGLKKSTSSMNKGEKNVNFPKSKKINNPDYKSTTVDINETKPSAGLSKEKKSEVVKKAKKGGDIGKKGKGFEKIVAKAKEGGAKDPEAVAAAAMWKNIKREQKEIDEWVDSLIENDYHCLTTKDEIMELINVKLIEQDPAIAEPDIDIDTDTEVDEPHVDPNEDPFIDPWKEPGVGPDPDPKFETGKEQLPDFLKFDNIVNSMNESTIDNISSIILQKIKNGKK